MDSSSFPIEHEPQQTRFVYTEPGSATAVLKYALRRGRSGMVVDFEHTWVPEDQRGRGIGRALVRAGHEHAKARGWLIEASCPFARFVLKEKT